MRQLNNTPPPVHQTLGTLPKIPQLQPHIPIQIQTLQLNIPVHNILPPQLQQHLHQLIKVILHLPFSDPLAAVEQFLQGPVGAGLDDYVDVRTVFEHVVEF